MPNIEMMLAEWQAIRRSAPSWYWCFGQLHHGDIYHVCSLATAFRRYHGTKPSIRAVLTSSMQSGVLDLFSDAFEEIIVASRLIGSPVDWCAFLQSTRLPSFGLDAPLVLDPQSNPDVGNFEPLDNPIRLFARILRLPTSVQPSPPQSSVTNAQHAELLCKQAGMRRHRSVILFPYARGLPVDAVAYFFRLAVVLTHQGYTVVTSVAGDEVPIKETTGCNIPFSVLPDAARYAGWIIAVRSGIADILSSVDCRKTIIYPSLETLRLWNLRRLRLSADAEEFVFDFAREPAEDFIELVLVRYVDHDGPTHRGLSIPWSASSNSLATLREIVLRGICIAIRDVPPYSQAHARNDVAASILALLNVIQVRIFACQDPLLMFDYYEPIDLADFASGTYYRATGWHALWVVPNEAVAPSPRRTLPDQSIIYGRPIQIADAYGGPEFASLVSGRMPFCCEGIQFLDGWSEPESWGIWSLSCSSTMKIRLPGVPSGDVSVRLKMRAALFLETKQDAQLRISCNDSWVSSSRIRGDLPFNFDLRVPQSVVPSGSILLTFALEHVASPLAQGVSQDPRELGLAILEVTIDQQYKP